MNDLQDMKGMLGERFKHFEPKPPRDLWPAIEAEMNQPSSKSGFWTYLSIAAAIILLLGIRFSLRNGQSTVRLLPAGEQSIAQLDTSKSQTTPSSKQPPLSQANTSKKQLSTTATASHPPAQQAESDGLTFPNMADDSTMPKQNNATTSPYKQTTALRSENAFSIPDHDIATINPEQVISSSTGRVEGVEFPALPESAMNPQPIKTIEKLPGSTRLSSASEPTKQVIGDKSGTASLESPSDKKIMAVAESRTRELTFEKALFIASEELGKLVKNSPLEAYEEQLQDDEVKVRTIQFRIGDFKITRKKIIHSNS